MLLLAGVLSGRTISRAADKGDYFADEMSDTNNESQSVDAGKRAEFKKLLDVNKMPHDGPIALDFFRHYYDEFGPDVIRAALDDIPFCHAQAHNFGRVIYEHTKDLAQATTICRDSCTAGCIHGVLMSMFEEKSDGNASVGEHITLADMNQQMRHEIAGICSEKGSVSKYTGVGNCFHAVGHALDALASNDIPSAIDLCQIFNDSGAGAVYYCATGVYMERDIEMGQEDAKISSAFPCTLNKYSAGCFRYKLRRIFDLRSDYIAAKEICLGLSGSEQTGCFHGLGFGAYRAVLRDPSKVDAICSGGDEIDTRLCLEGMFGIINLYDRKVPPRACEIYPGDTTLCKAASEVRNFDMKRDFRPYISE